MCPEAVVVNHEDVFGVCGRGGELLDLAEKIGGGLGEVVSISYIIVSTANTLHVQPDELLVALKSLVK
jgi:hypothetical protein